MTIGRIISSTGYTCWIEFSDGARLIRAAYVCERVRSMGGKLEIAAEAISLQVKVVVPRVSDEQEVLIGKRALEKIRRRIK